MKYTTLLLAAGLSVTSAYAQDDASAQPDQPAEKKEMAADDSTENKKMAAPSIEEAKTKASYQFGRNFSKQFKEDPFIVPTEFIKGLQEALDDKGTDLSDEEFEAAVGVRNLVSNIR